jgi:RNA polymerase sigma factor (sigma-70 family)
MGVDSEFFEANMKLVPFTVRRYYPELVHDEDAFQEGYIALWKACCGYDSEQMKFSTYAVRSIKNAVSCYHKKLYTKPNVTRTLSINSHYDNRVDWNLPAAEDSFSELETKMLIDAFRKTLSPKRLELFDLLLAGHSRHEIARELGVTHQCVSQRGNVLKRKLRRYLNTSDWRLAR